jgi:signal transduction histidine kinase
MFTSLRARLWLTYVLLVGVALGIVGIGILIYLLRNPILDRRTLLRLEVIADTILQRSDINTPGALINLQAVSRRASEVFGGRFLILASDGTLVLDSQADVQPTLTSLGRIINNPATRIILDISGQPWLIVVRPINQAYYLIVAALRPTRASLALKTMSDDLLGPFIRASLVAMLLALILAYGVARWVAGPLQRVAGAARSVAEGEYCHLHLEGPQEVKVLGKAFNEMIDRVQTSRDSQRDFVANVSHELKTPLTSIQGFAQAMLDGAIDSPQSSRRAAQVIFDEAGRMYRLVLDLLDLARFDAGTIDLQRQPVNLVDLLRYVVEKFTIQAQQQQVELSFEQSNPANGLPIFIGDGDRLVQVFTNLVDNALKHTPAGGKITVQTRLAHPHIEISVTDTGVGIPPEELARIFDRFYQVDKSRPGGQGRGVGLGLAIAREIVHTHGGMLTAQSKPAQGSVFVVKLPFEPLC